MIYIERSYGQFQEIGCICDLQTRKIHRKFIINLISSINPRKAKVAFFIINEDLERIYCPFED